MMPMQLFELDPPAKWRAGFDGGTEENGGRPFYFHCGYCGAKEPEIAAFYGTGPTFSEIGILKVDGGPFCNPAMMCQECYDKLKAKSEVNHYAKEEVPA